MISMYRRVRKCGGRNAEKNHLNHPDSTISGSGDVVQLGLFPADGYQSNYQPAATGVAAKSNLGVEIMAVTGVVLALAGVVVPAGVLPCGGQPGR